MRVLQVSWTALPIAGGVETHLDVLTHQLRRLGATVDVLHGTKEAAGIYHPQLDIRRPAGAGVGDVAAIAARYDVVHLHNPQWHKPEVAAALVRALDGPVVLADVHNVDASPERWAVLAGLDVPLIVHSSFIADQVRAAVPDASVTTVPLALDLRREPYELPAGGTVILQPTRLCDWKGSDLSLTAVLDLLDDGYDLTFVHAGSEHLIWPTGLTDELLDRMKPYQESGRIRLVHYSLAESWSAIAAADLILHPTVADGPHGEPFSLSVAQAIVCGVPVIASTSGYLPRLLDGYGPSRLVPTADGYALREAIRSVLADPLPPPGPAEKARAEDLSRDFTGSGARHIELYERLGSRPCVSPI